MSADARDKPFAPTAHKLTQARERGEVPGIQDLPSTLGLLAAVVFVLLAAPAMARAGQGLLDTLLTLAITAGTDALRVDAALRVWAWQILWISLPPVLVAGLVGTLVKRLLVGPVASMKPVTPDFNRLNPVNGMKRLVSSETWVMMLKALFSALVIALVIFAWLQGQLTNMLAAGSPQQALVVATHLLGRELLLGTGILAVISMADAAYQVWNFRTRMRMDHKDMRDEYKQQEGNPEVKSQRRQEHKRLASGG